MDREMSVVSMQSVDPRAPQSGSGMDRVVARRGLPKWATYAAGGVLVVLALLLFWWFAPARNSQTIAADRLTISTVAKGRFDDFVPLRGRVTPLVTVFLDAVEGGRVEKLYVEDGAMVKKGQMLAELSNSDLQNNLLARQADVSREMNSMRNMELALAQTRVGDRRNLIEAELTAQKARRQYEMQRPLAEKGFIAGRTMRDSKDDYDSSLRRLQVLKTGETTDERLQTLQVKLTLGDPTSARLIPNGAFYTETGGAWVFVVAPDGKSAVKRQVRLGRRNQDSIEVLEGLEPGERVITSPYTGFADKDRLNLGR